MWRNISSQLAISGKEVSGMGNLVSLLLSFSSPKSTVPGARNLLSRWYKFCDMVFGGGCDLGEIWVKVLWHWPHVSAFSTMSEVRGWILISVSQPAAHYISIAATVLRIEQVREVAWGIGVAPKQMKGKPDVTGSWHSLEDFYLPKRGHLSSLAGLWIL